MPDQSEPQIRGMLEAAPEAELAQLREEVRRLRDQQERQNKNGAHESEDSNSRDNGGSESGGEDQPKGKNEPDKNGKEKSEDQGEKKPPKTSPLKKLIFVCAALLIAAGALVWYLHARHFEDTDDATVDGHISGLSARISGTITGVYVEENQFVKGSQVVVDLDPRDNKIAFQQAKSQLYQAQAQTQAEQPNIPVTEVTNQTNISTTNADVASARAGVASAEQDYQAALARVAEAEANNAKAQADVERYRPLAEKDEVPREQFDQVVANAKALAATVASAQATAEAARKQIEQRRAQLAQAEQRAEEARQNAPRALAIRRANVITRQASAQAAKAQYDQAELNLSYCKIISPVDGIVAKRMAEIGQRISPGQELLLISQLNDLWVTANYKETQLRRMRPGQGVRIHVDALDGDFDGYIESMPASTGTMTSLLPPENATGNYVKVVQRLPVRIRFKKDQNGLDRLRPGMSVEPKVRVD